MKQRLFLAFAMLMTSCLFCWAGDGTLIAERDYTGIEEFSGWNQFGDGQEGNVSVDPDGLAITVGSQTGQLWQPQVMVIPDEILLQKGGNYKVVVTAKFPCNGTLQINLGSWSGNYQNPTDVVATGDFQEVEMQFPNFKSNCINADGNGDAHVLLHCGDFLGTIIVQKVQVWDMDNEAYAVYDSNSKTLTFYYDDLKNTYGDNAYYLNIENRTPGWIDHQNPKEIKKVKFHSSFMLARPTSTYDWFYCQSSLTEIEGIGFLNTSMVENMDEMFYGCSSLTTLDLSTFDTSRVKSMSSMFNGCTNLGSLNLLGWNTSNVTNMCNIFSSCSSLTTLDLGSFDTSNVTDMSYMFYRCSSLSRLNLSSFNTSNVTNMCGMFFFCSNLESLTLGNSFYTSNVTEMSYMFSDCGKLTTLDLSSFNTSNVTKMDGMFCACESLKTIIVGKNWSTEKVDDSNLMFFNCTNLVGCVGTVYNENKTDKAYARIDEGSSYPGYLSAIPEAYVLYDRTTRKLTFYYDGLRYTARRMGTTYDLNEGFSLPGWISDKCNIDKVVFHESFKNARPTSTSSWFSGMKNLTSIDLGNLNTSEVTIMESMFINCESLMTISFGESFNTYHVTDMSYMFFGCSSLTELDLSKFNTAIVTNMTCMFYDCSSQTALDLSSFNTCNVTNMSSMFDGCSNLATITVGKNWNTGSVTDSSNMFMECGKLKGGAGTTYNIRYVDKEYAHVDGLGGPGYLTAVSYGITVDGKAVTFANKYDVLGNETVYYDDDLNILTLNYAQLSVVNVTETAPDNLLIEVNGNCTITAQLGNAFTTSIKTTTIEGAGKLTITSEKGIGIYMPLKKSCRLIVRNIELVVQGKTCGIQGNYSGRIFYTDLGFDNVKCAVRTTGSSTEPSVGYINSMTLRKCDWTIGAFDENRHKVAANPMLIERDGAGITTGVERLNDNGEMINDKARDAWFTIDGQKLSGKPTQKGIYIQHGKKVVIK